MSITIKLLKELLNKFDDNLEVQFETAIQEPCNCGDYCYCQAKPVRFYINDIDLETLDVDERNGWDRKPAKKLKKPVIMFRGARL